jgi:IclR family acetate operon transcriptional repressor
MASELKKRGRPRRDGEAAGAEVQSLVRGLSLMGVLARGEGMTLKDIAQATDLPLTTAHRLIGTLLAHGFAQADPDRGTYTVGAEAFRVGMAYLAVRKLVEIARPHLKALLDATHETANLALLEGDAIIYAAQAESHLPVRAFFRPGRRTPLAVSAVGKACLAALDPDERAARLAGLRLDPPTPKAAASLEALAARIDAARRDGFAIDDEEQSIGLRCIGAAILDERGQPVGGVSISGPTARLTDERMEQLSDQVKRTAATITQAFGGRGR